MIEIAFDNWFPDKSSYLNSLNHPIFWDITIVKLFPNKFSETNFKSPIISSGISYINLFPVKLMILKSPKLLL